MEYTELLEGKEPYKKEEEENVHGTGRCHNDVRVQSGVPIVKDHPVTKPLESGLISLLVLAIAFFTENMVHSLFPSIFFFSSRGKPIIIPWSYLYHEWP